MMKPSSPPPIPISILFHSIAGKFHARIMSIRLKALAVNEKITQTESVEVPSSSY